MYHVDDDTLVELGDIPQSCVGSPRPVVISDEYVLLLAYAVEDAPSFEPGHILTDADMVKFAPHTALIEFQRYTSFNFGYPGDETLHGHRLNDRGLTAYSAFEVQRSSWIRELDRIDSVHPFYEPGRFDSKHHYIFTFHDSTFECVALGYQVTEYRKALGDLVIMMTERLMDEE